MQMERKVIVHYERTPGTGACGDELVQTTLSRESVTCARCIARLPAIEDTWPIGEEREGERGAHTLTVGEARMVMRSIAGEDEEGRFRWRSLDAAFAQYVRVIDDGTPMRSSFRDEMPVQGGTGNTRSTGREEVIAVEVALERAFTEPRTYRDVTLSPADQRRIFELVRFGRVEPKRIAPGRKGYITQRVPCSATEVAEVVLGGQLTAHEVGLLARSVDRIVGAHLEEKKELRPRQRNEERETSRAEGEDMALPKGFDLEGWKDIAGHIGCAVSTAESLATRADDANPLPVVRGYLSRVIAKKSEIDEWMTREVERVRVANRSVRSQHASPPASQLSLLGAEGPDEAK